MAKLHCICGSCGSDQHFRLDLYVLDIGPGEDKPQVTLVCENCSTVQELCDIFPTHIH